MQERIHQVWLLLRNVLETRLQKLALGRPCLGEVGDHVVVSNWRRIPERLARKLCPQRSDHVMPLPKPQMAERSATRIHFDQIGGIGLILNHEIQPEESR